MGVRVPAKGRHFEVDVVDDSWKSFKKHLVQTEEELNDLIRRIREEKPQLIGFDTETTGLDFNKLEMVGCSLAWRESEAFYIPFGHKVGVSLPVERFGDLWQAIHDTAILIAAYNKRFDYRVVRKTLQGIGKACPGIWNSKMFEVAAVVWNADTDRWGPRARLKVVAKGMLGWDLDTFEKTLGEATDLSWRDPEEVVDYAALDALIVIHLLRYLKKLWQERQDVVDLDNMMTSALVEIEDQVHPLNIGFCEWAKERNSEDATRILEQLKEMACKRLADKSRHEIRFENEEELRGWAVPEFRRLFELNLEKMNPNSTKDLEKLFRALELDTGARTEKGKMSFSEKALDALEEAGSSDELLEKIIAYRKSMKNVEYLTKFIGEGKELGGVRCSYNTTRVTTGRLSASKSPGNSYFYSASIHTVKKAKKAAFLAVPGHEILGYDFIELSRDADGRLLTPTKQVVGVDIDGVVVEGKKKDHTNVRRALCARPGHYFVHIDYNAEEVRILGNIAEDESIVRSFEGGKDPHAQTAVDLFGRYDPEKRGLCKGINFLSSYGGSAFSLAKKVGISQEEAEVYMDRWWRLRSGVRRWKQMNLERATRVGYVETVLGRIRWVDYSLFSQDFRERSKGERLCLNSPIQGSGGELIRIVLVKIQRKIAPKYGEDFQCLSTVHDEINTSMAIHRFNEIRVDVATQMDITFPGWKIPMVAEFEVGFDWGNTFKFDFLEDGTAVPKEMEV